MTTDTRRRRKGSVGRYSSKMHDPDAGPTVTKTETVAEYMARGGEVRRLETGPPVKMTNTVWMDPSKAPVVVGR